MMMVLALGMSMPDLDDGGADEDVGVPFDKAFHGIFEVVFVHLAVADVDAGARAKGAQFRGDLIDVGDAVVEEEDLAAALQFALDGIADDAFVVGADMGSDRHAIGRGGFDRAHVARTHERHVERARDGRGAKREHVHECERVA